MEKTARVKLVVLLVVIVLVLIVTFQNIEARPFQILFWSLSVSPSITIIVTFLLGILGGILLRLGRK